jgi:hypothetical protein
MDRVLDEAEKNHKENHKVYIRLIGSIMELLRKKMYVVDWKIVLYGLYVPLSLSPVWYCIMGQSVQNAIVLRKVPRPGTALNSSREGLCGVARSLVTTNLESQLKFNHRCDSNCSMPRKNPMARNLSTI